MNPWNNEIILDQDHEYWPAAQLSAWATAAIKATKTTAKNFIVKCGSCFVDGTISTSSTVARRWEGNDREIVCLRRKIHQLIHIKLNDGGYLYPSRDLNTPDIRKPNFQLHHGWYWSNEISWGATSHTIFPRPCIGEAVLCPKDATLRARIDQIILDPTKDRDRRPPTKLWGEIWTNHHRAFTKIFFFFGVPSRLCRVG
jgi:hypothetical protein